MQQSQGRQHSAPDPTQPYRDADLRALNNRSLPSRRTTSILYGSSYPDSYLDNFNPTPAMIKSMFSASKVHKDAFDNIYSRRGKDSDFAIVGQAISPLKPGEQPISQIYYVQLGRKMVHFIQNTMVRWFGRWKKELDGIEARSGPFTAERLDLLKQAAYVQSTPFEAPFDDNSLSWKDDAVTYLGDYHATWGYAYGFDGMPVWTNASLAGPELDGPNVVLEPLADPPPLMVDPPSSGSMLSSSSPSGPKLLSSHAGMVSSMISATSQGTVPHNAQQLRLDCLHPAYLTAPSQFGHSVALSSSPPRPQYAPLVSSPAPPSATGTIPLVSRSSLGTTIGRAGPPPEPHVATQGAHLPSTSHHYVRNHMSNSVSDSSSLSSISQTPANFTAPMYIANETTAQLREKTRQLEIKVESTKFNEEFQDGADQAVMWNKFHSEDGFYPSTTSSTRSTPYERRPVAARALANGSYDYRYNSSLSSLGLGSLLSETPSNPGGDRAVLIGDRASKAHRASNRRVVHAKNGRVADANHGRVRASGGYRYGQDSTGHTTFAGGKRVVHTNDGRVGYANNGHVIFTGGERVVHTNDGRVGYANDGHTTFAGGKRAVHTNDGRVGHTNDGHAIFAGGERAVHTNDGHVGYANDGHATFAGGERVVHTNDGRVGHTDDELFIYPGHERVVYTNDGFIGYANNGGVVDANNGRVPAGSDGPVLHTSGDYQSGQDNNAYGQASAPHGPASRSQGNDGHIFYAGDGPIIHANDSDGRVVDANDGYVPTDGGSILHASGGYSQASAAHGQDDGQSSEAYRQAQASQYRMGDGHGQITDEYSQSSEGYGRGQASEGYGRGQASEGYGRGQIGDGYGQAGLGQIGNGYGQAGLGQIGNGYGQAGHGKIGDGCGQAGHGQISDGCGQAGHGQIGDGCGQTIDGYDTQVCHEGEHGQAGNEYGYSQPTDPHAPVADECGHPTDQFDDATGYESVSAQGTSTYANDERTDEDAEDRPMSPNTGHANKFPVAHGF